MNPLSASRSLLAAARRRLRASAPYALAHELRLVLRRRRAARRENRVVTLVPAGRPRGRVLLSYKLDPFLGPRGAPISNRHSQDGESVLMAQTFLDLGYTVDVISFRNGTFVPAHAYDFFVDVRWNLQRLAARLGPRCCKIMHIDVCHILHQNVAEGRRLLALQQRRGATLQPRRFEWPNLAIEHADCATILGNEFTQATFAYARKPLFPVPIVPSNGFAWPEGKDFDATRRRFLWFGSGGLVRKGLDLVLEVFARLPDHHLTICGPVAGETDFARAYHRELFETPNIETVGWVDIDGARFRDICRGAAFLIFPSCAEGQCGSVVVAMQAGVIPIVSYETGVDVGGRGFLLPGCELAQIAETVKRVSQLPAAELEQSARAAWRYAREHHSREAFARAFRGVIEGILANRTGTNAAASGATIAAKPPCDPRSAGTGSAPDLRPVPRPAPIARGPRGGTANAEAAAVAARRPDGGAAGGGEVSRSGIFRRMLIPARRPRFTPTPMNPVDRLLVRGARRMQRWLKRSGRAPVATSDVPFDNRYDWLGSALLDLRRNPVCAKRPAYIWGVLQGAALGKVLGLGAVSVLEFGVAGGAGLLAMEAAAIAAEEKIGIRIEVHGFDTGRGLPKPLDYRDCPNIWIGEGQFPMDADALRRRLRRAALHLGPIAETVGQFIDSKAPPVAFASIDVDLYSSTMDVFRLFDAGHDRLLPRVLCYFDDIMGLTYGDFNGERLAIHDFNAAHAARKLSPLYGLKFYLPAACRNDPWNEALYFLHLHDHPLYAAPDEIRKPMIMDVDAQVTGWISGTASAPRRVT